MRRHFILVSALILWAITLCMPVFAQGTMLTVSGAVEKTNRGAFDPFYDGFLNFHDKSFDKAFEFDWATLAGLPQQSISVAADVGDWPAETLEMKGPLLKDVLAAAGASGKQVTLYALDGFGLTLDPEKLGAHDWVLAMSVNGKPLGIGGFGPLWLTYDTGGKKAPESEEKSWVWSVFHIEVE